MEQKIIDSFIFSLQIMKINFIDSDFNLFPFSFSSFFWI